MKTPLSWLAAVVAALALAPAKPLAKAEKQINIIFFLSDDHRQTVSAVPVIRF